ncbi:GNAT family N-acetyltransferase [Enterococcus sp.]|uniref:GNAT family N-acetyltransferase n=1 Tax=Enterococcus sp. TaxID=35783 RepID=UPI000EE5807D|nr:GNAT family N-acetyltransferase [Enterococcus sp.]HCE11959.1 GNAT family N-acetyltransferase [Enterococcus sp.]
MMIVFQEGVPHDEAQILALYQEVGWTLYTRKPEKLLAGLRRSDVLAAYDQERLVGLIRAVTDGETILYIQDLLVLPNYQRQNIGRTLLEKMIAAFPDVRQKILLTDDQIQSMSFYEACGFKQVGKTGGVAYGFSS